MNKKKKANIVKVVCLVAVIVIGATFAFWTQKSTVDNPFDTSKYGSTIREDFKPSEGEDWQPGVKVEKKVKAVNTGDTDLIVRARLDETWTRKVGAPASVEPGQPGKPYKDSLNDPYNVYTTNQVSHDDGLTKADGSVVIKEMLNSANWIAGPEGWYYYRINLEGGKSTENFLDSVELLDNADMGKMETKKYVSSSTGANEDSWTWFEYEGKMPKYINSQGKEVAEGTTGAQQVLHNKTETKYVEQNKLALLGYSQSDYNLKVTTETVQATEEAVNAVFGNNSTFTPPNGVSWKLKAK